MHEQKYNLPPQQIEMLRPRIKQLGESKKLMRSTVSPPVFFGRLSFVMDTLLDLQRYEVYGIFNDKTPTRDIRIIQRNLGQIVDDFIDRAIDDNKRKLEKIKTAKARYENYEKFLIALISAFDCADTFWTGNKTCPHYTGPLFTQENYERVQCLYDGLDELYDPALR